MSASEKEVRKKESELNQHGMFAQASKPLSLSFAWVGDQNYYSSENPPLLLGEYKYIELQLHDKPIYIGQILKSTATDNQSIPLDLMNLSTKVLVHSLRIKSLETAKNLKLRIHCIKELPGIGTVCLYQELAIDFSALQLGACWQLRISNINKMLSTEFVKLGELSDSQMLESTSPVGMRQ